ncbi:MAG: hypothetical protein ACR2GR_04890 [Rhodothermales bacterium]
MEKNNQAEGTLARVRAARRRISEQFDHDPQRLIEHYIEEQQKYKDRLLSVRRAQQGNEEAD